jgi:saccharopine dehydrogenase-like NADP-dependent oxidoreductase
MAKRIVVFGAGLVAKAHVRYLLEHGIQVTVASRTVSKAEDIVAGHPGGRPEAFDIQRQPERLPELVASHDLAVSLLPYAYHPQVAKLCIANGKNMVTTSYVSPEMQALDEPAREAGVTILNEIGVDPGIDHMTAMKVINAARAEGGSITSFTSYCGGLPAPEANDNPFGYKFSWSPKGVLLAGKNAARFRKGGEKVEVPGEELFDHHWPVSVEIEGRAVELEGYPNRDSLPYQHVYGIEPRDTMFRGTLRYPGWCSTLKKIAELGMLDDDERSDLEGSTFAQLTARLTGTGVSPDLRSALAKKLGVEPGSFIVDNLDWLGLLGDEPLPAGASTCIDVLTETMLAKMRYAPGERDMIVLQHQFLTEYPDRRERITSTMIDFGIPGGDTSMSRTVGLPAAVGARFIVGGKISAPGVLVPVQPEIYEPVLEELGRLGITFSETSERIA